MPRTVARRLIFALLVFAGLVGSPLVARPPLEVETAFPGGTTVALRGLAVSASATTNLGFVNLAPAANRCSLALTAAEGTSLLPPVTMTLRAFEERPFLDVFEGLTDAFAGAEAKASISCEHAFSAFAVLADAAGEPMQTIAPEKVASANSG